MDVIHPFLSEQLLTCGALSPSVIFNVVYNEDECQRAIKSNSIYILW